MARNDYPYEASGWNLSPIMFQPGTFLASAARELGYRRVKLVGQGQPAGARLALGRASIVPSTESPTSVTDVLTDDVLRAGADDPELFSLVYRTYASQVLGYLTARGVEDPEAVMQEVFLAVLPRLETVSGGMHGLRTFIFSVAHARMVDDHRRQSRTPVRLPFDAEQDQREESSAEAEALERVSPSEILGLLQGLVDEQKEVLTLRLIGGLTVDQVAAVMGKSPGAVKQLQRRALNRLREETSVKEYVAP